MKKQRILEAVHGSKTGIPTRASKGTRQYFSPLLLIDFICFFFSFEKLNQVNKTFTPPGKCIFHKKEIS